MASTRDRGTGDLIKDTFEIVRHLQQLIDPLTSEVSRLSQRISVLEAKLAAQEMANGKLAKALYEGNGSPPIASQLVTINQRIGQIEENQKERKESYRHQVGVWLAIVLAVIGIVAQVIFD